MDDTRFSNQPQTLADYATILRRRKWLVLLAVVLVPAAALVLSLRQSARYDSTASVVLSQQDVVAQLTGITDPALSEDPVRYTQTQAAVARLPDVVESAVTSAGVAGVNAADLLRNSTVKADPNADQLHFTVSSADRQSALQLASAYASAFIAYQGQLGTAALTQARTQISARQTQLRRNGRADTPLYRRLATELQQLNALEVIQGSNSLLDPPRNASQTEPRTKRNLALGIVAGLALGIMLAFLAEAFERRVTSADEIELGLGLPVLARLPSQPRRFRRGGVALAAVADERGGTVEAFRRLRTRLELANREVGAQTIMITSAVKREGKSTTITNLAASLAAGGKHVTLVDLDLRQPAVGRMFGLGDAPGLMEVLRGQVSLDEALVPVQPESMMGRSTPSPADAGVPLLEVLLAGQGLPSDPTRVVASADLWQVIDSLAERSDLVLIDAPPLLSVAESMLLATKVDAVVVLARVYGVPRRALLDLRDVLLGLSVPKLGLVIAGASEDAAYGYGYNARSSASTELQTTAVVPITTPLAQITPDQLRSLHAKAGRADRVNGWPRRTAKQQVLAEATDRFGVSIVSADDLDELQTTWVLDRLDELAQQSADA